MIVELICLIWVIILDEISEQYAEEDITPFAVNKSLLCVGR
jgi:hypothetical protein